jgi:hypothetical protein
MRSKGRIVGEGGEREEEKLRRGGKIGGRRDKKEKDMEHEEEKDQKERKRGRWK